MWLCSSTEGWGKNRRSKFTARSLGDAHRLLSEGFRDRSAAEFAAVLIWLPEKFVQSRHDWWSSFENGLAYFVQFGAYDRGVAWPPQRRVYGLWRQLFVTRENVVLEIHPSSSGWLSKSRPNHHTLLSNSSAFNDRRLSSAIVIFPMDTNIHQLSLHKFPLDSFHWRTNSDRRYLLSHLKSAIDDRGICRCHSVILWLHFQSAVIWHYKLKQS